MGRKYPRFLYSNPHNTKSKGPFIVHLFDPKIICKVSLIPPDSHWTEDSNIFYKNRNGIRYEVLNAEEFSNLDVHNTLDFLTDWFESQREFDKLQNGIN